MMGGKLIPQIVELYFFGMLQAAEEWFVPDVPRSTFYLLNARSAQMFAKRLRLWSDLHQCLQLGGTFLGYFHEAVLPEAGLPPFWIPGEHDEVLVEHIFKHGLESSDRGWRQYLKDPMCHFYSGFGIGTEVQTLREAQQQLQAFVTMNNPSFFNRLRSITNLILRESSHNLALGLDDNNGEKEGENQTMAEESGEAAEEGSGRIGVKSITTRQRAPPGSALKRTIQTKYAESVKNQNKGTKRERGEMSNPAPVAIPGLPVVLSNGVTVTELGRVEYLQEGFHNKLFIWPVGFRSYVMTPSIADPSLQVKIWSEIHDAGSGQPLFVVRSEEYPEGQYVGPSPTHAWEKAFRWLHGFTASRSGPKLYGLSEPLIVRMIQQLPNASNCCNYRWQYFGEFRAVDSELTRHPKRRVKQPPPNQSATSPPSVHASCISSAADSDFDSEEEEKWHEQLYRRVPIQGFSIYNVAKRVLANCRQVMGDYPLPADWPCSDLPFSKAFRKQRLSSSEQRPSSVSSSSSSSLSDAPVHPLPSSSPPDHHIWVDSHPASPTMSLLDPAYPGLSPSSSYIVFDPRSLSPSDFAVKD